MSYWNNPLNLYTAKPPVKPHKRPKLTADIIDKDAPPRVWRRRLIIKQQIEQIQTAQLS